MLKLNINRHTQTHTDHVRLVGVNNMRCRVCVCAHFVYSICIYNTRFRVYVLCVCVCVCMNYMNTRFRLDVCVYFVYSTYYVSYFLLRLMFYSISVMYILYLNVTLRVFCPAGLQGSPAGQQPNLAIGRRYELTNL